MTNPGAGGSDFSYSDDSVVAKISVEVPGQAAADLNAIISATSNLRTEMEALGRAEGDHLGYVAQLPQYAEQANQAYRNLITSMERVAYLQREMGGMPNVGPSGLGGAGGAGGYSTAAPQGYVNPFQGMTSGMRGGVPQNMDQASAYLAQIQQQNPQLFANMMAQRGINPASFGPAGSQVFPHTPGSNVGGTGEGQGQGAEPPASSSPQATQSARRSAAPPDPTTGGAPLGSEDAADTPEPHPDAPGWQHVAYAAKSGARQILNEAAASGGRLGGMANMATRAMSAGGSLLGKIGGGGGNLAGIGKGLGIAGAGITAAVGANELLGRAGQEVTRYSQLGSVQGGGVAEGFGYEMQARLMSTMNPFITTDQSRQIMQMALKEGFRGGNFDTVQDFMAKNFKDMSMSFADSMNMAKSAVTSANTSGKGFNETLKDMSNSLSDMKQLAKKGGASLPTRQAQMAEAVAAQTDLGVSSEMAARGANMAAEMYPNDQLLNQNLPNDITGAMQNPNFLMMIGQAEGVGGGFPEAIPGELEDKGISVQEAAMKLAKPQAQAIAARVKDPRQGAALFMRTMNSMGWPMKYSTALDLYKKLTGTGEDADPVGRAKRSLAAGGNRTWGERFSNLGGDLERMAVGPAEAVGDLFQGNFGEAAKDVMGPITGGVGLIGDTISDLFSDSRVPPASNQDFAPKGNPPPPKSPAPGSPGSGTRPEQTTQVGGELRISVDQQGRVSAPQTISLTGVQRSVNAGFGGQTLNGPGQGDPSYNHAYSNWSGG